MLDRKEIDIEISRLEYGESSYPAYAKLADLYTIRDQMDKTESPNWDRGYSEAAKPVEHIPQGDSDFLMLAAEKDPDGVWEILDDLMDTLRVTNPRVYRGIMRRLNDL